MNGSIDPYQNTTEGAEISFMCNPEFVPAGRMTAVCGADGRWSPDPANHRCTCEYPSKLYSCHHHTKIFVYISCTFVPIGNSKVFVIMLQFFYVELDDSYVP